MNTSRTSQAIRSMATVLREYADSLDRKAKQLDENSDFEICGEVINMIANMNSSLRLDLIVNRPIREFQKALNDAESR